jgi:hypothetical protein
LLKPGKIVALGKGTKYYVDKLYTGTTPIYGVERVIGDSYLSMATQRDINAFAEIIVR